MCRFTSFRRNRFLGQEIFSNFIILIVNFSARRPSFIPGHELENIFTIRSLEDAEKVMGALNPEKKLVVVGSSFIGELKIAVNKS